MHVQQVPISLLPSTANVLQAPCPATPNSPHIGRNQPAAPPERHGSVGGLSFSTKSAFLLLQTLCARKQGGQTDICSLTPSLLRSSSAHGADFSVLATRLSQPVASCRSREVARSLQPAPSACGESPRGAAGPGHHSWEEGAGTDTLEVQRFEPPTRLLAARPFLLLAAWILSWGRGFVGWLL